MEIDNRKKEQIKALVQEYAGIFQEVTISYKEAIDVDKEDVVTLIPTASLKVILDGNGMRAMAAESKCTVDELLQKIDYYFQNKLTEAGIKSAVDFIAQKRNISIEAAFKEILREIKTKSYNYPDEFVAWVNDGKLSVMRVEEIQGKDFKENVSVVEIITSSMRGDLALIGQQSTAGDYFIR